VASAATREDLLQLARNFLADQDYTSATRYYREYLSTAQEELAFAPYVIEASLAIAGVDNQILFIRQYLSKATSFSDRFILHKHIAFLFEYIGDYGNAIANYVLAYEVSRPLAYDLYLRAAKLNFEHGEYPRALYMARVVRGQITETRLKNELLIIMIRSMLVLNSDLEDIEQLIRSERLFLENEAQSNLLYLLYLGYQRRQQFSRSQEFKSILIKKFPQSPEAGIVSGRIRQVISPSLLWW
jgi:hypothetical protein